MLIVANSTIPWHDVLTYMQIKQ